MNTPAHATMATKKTHHDYRLIGGAAEQAAQAGLVNANWYKCAVPRAQLKALMQRSDAQAIRDTVLWYALILVAGGLVIAAGLSAGLGASASAGAAATVWALAAYFLYATLYCGPADSRWHECGHGTAFKTPWMNKLVYQLASFQVLRRPTIWRWSHARHHTDTLVTGRDPEIAVPLPASIGGTLLNLFALRSGPREVWRMLRNAAGGVSAEEKTYVPAMEWQKVVNEARVWVLMYAAIVALAVALGSWLPVLLLGPVPSMVGAWLYVFFGLTQHAGLPENVLDHRLNCRTVYMNPVFRFLYWNMNYHIEHHMFPMVPFHALPQLHEAVKADCPMPYRSTLQAYREIIPALLRQARDANYYVKRVVPTRVPTDTQGLTAAAQDMAAQPATAQR